MNELLEQIYTVKSKLNTAKKEYLFHFHHYEKSGVVARSDAHSPGMLMFAGSILTSGNIL